MRSGQQGRGSGGRNARRGLRDGDVGGVGAEGEGSSRKAGHAPCERAGGRRAKLRLELRVRAGC